MVGGMGRSSRPWDHERASIRAVVSREATEIELCKERASRLSSGSAIGRVLGVGVWRGVSG
jgi:hypothetical protein